MKTPKEIGGILREARQKKDISLEKVYKATRMRSRLVEAFEEGIADELLSRVYVMLFLRKYASFLGLDAERLVRDYRASYAGEEAQILDYVEEKTKDKAIVNIDWQKWAKPASRIAITFLVIFFALFSVAKVKSFFETRRKRTTAVSLKATGPFIHKEDIFPIPKDKPVELTLRATDDAWMRVKVDRKRAFEGTLHENQKKSWFAEEIIELWVGRAEALDFAINGKSVGKIGKGSIKAVRISRNGLKIKNKWLLKAK